MPIFFDLGLTQNTDTLTPTFQPGGLNPPSQVEDLEGWLFMLLRQLYDFLERFS